MSRILSVVKEFPGLHIKELERLLRTRRVYIVVKRLEMEGLVKTMRVRRFLGGQLKFVKAVFTSDTLDPGLDFLVTWIRSHGDLVYYVDAVEDDYSIIIALHGVFSDSDVLDLRSSLEFSFGFRVIARQFNQSRIHNYVVIIVPKLIG